MGKDTKDQTVKTALPLRLELPKLGGGAGTSRATAPAATGTSAALAAAVAAPPVPLSIPQLASLEDFGADDEDDDGTETMLLQAITSFFSKREEENKAKRAQLINDTLAKIKANAEVVTGALAKDGKEAVAEAAATVAKLESSLDATAGEIKALTDKYREDLRALYNKYSGQYEQLTTVKQEVTVKMQQRKTGAKRKLSAFKSQSEKALGEMQERLDKMKPKKSPMDLYKAIETFNAS